MTRREELVKEIHGLNFRRNLLLSELEAIDQKDLSVAEMQIRELLRGTEINKETLELARSRQRR